MQKRIIGSTGLEISAIGLGCMGMSEFYGKADDNESMKVILHALESGVTMLDTADTYGNGHNEELIGRVLKEWRGDVVVATKFGIARTPGEYKRSINGRPEYVKEAAEASLKRLGREVIDLYYLHRVDAEVAIEDTVGAMADLVKEGKVRFIGLSEPSVDTMRRAHSEHPITAVQSEYSLWTRELEKDVLPAAREFGIGLVAYSPLGRGFLTGSMTKESISVEGDLRLSMPRFSGNNFDVNMRLTRALEKIAASKDVKAAQLAIAWLLHKGEDIVPIPGTRRIKYLDDNICAATICLSAEEMENLDKIFHVGAALGDRYTEEGMKGIGR